MHCAICQGAAHVTMHTYWYVRDDEIPISIEEYLKIYRLDAALCSDCVARRGKQWKLVAPKVARISAGAVFGLVAIVLPILMFNSTPRPSTGEVIGGTVLLGLFAGGAIGAAVFGALHLRSDPKRAVLDVVLEHREQLGVVGCSGFWRGARPTLVHLNGRSWRISS